MAFDGIFDLTDISTGTPTTPSNGAGGGGFGFGQILGMVGTGMKAYGQWAQGQEIAGAYEYNASLTLLGLGFDIENLNKSEAEYGSTQRAMYAKAGVTMSGSPLDVMLKTATNFEMDKQVATFNAQSRANMMEYQGKQAERKGKFDAAGTLISGAANLAITAGMFL